MPKIAQRQYLVKVAGIAEYFTTKSGGDISSDSTPVYDGGILNPTETLTGPAEIDNLTVSRAWDSRRDAAIVKTLRTRVGEFETSISVTPTDRSLRPIGPPVVYSGCVLVGLTEPEYDATSGDASEFELEFTARTVS